MLDETSALHGNVPQRNDEEGGKQPRLYFSPAASVWGHMGRAWTTGGRNAPRTTESITEKDYVACEKVPGTTSTPTSIMLQIGPARTTMSCGRWSAFVTTLILPPLTSGCSRVRATAAPISKSATSACRSRPICWWTSPCATISSAPVTLGRLKASSASPTTRITSSRAPLQDPQLSRHTSPQPACGFLAGVHVYLGPHPRRALAQWHVLRLWRCVAPPPPRVATSLPLTARRLSTWPTMIMTGMSATSTASPRIRPGHVIRVVILS
jgi:hypothetical protein